ncbi:MAG: transposase [Patescibacteria group bacterium]|nr:transposase [Patescibacteria group bacterium]
MDRKHWSSEEKIRIVLEPMNTGISLHSSATEHEVSPVQFYQCKEKFIEGGKMALSGPHE